MAREYKLLSEEDAEKLRRGLAASKGTAVNQKTKLQPLPSSKSSGIYLVLPPCGEPIPAAVTPDQPGYAWCCLFELIPLKKVQGNCETEQDPDQLKIVAVKNPDGSHIRVLVHNYHDIPAPDTRYIRATPTAHGYWICDRPQEGVGSISDATSTTAAPSNEECAANNCSWIRTATGWEISTNQCGTGCSCDEPSTGASVGQIRETTCRTSDDVTSTTVAPVAQCTGSCKWTWSVADGKWTLATKDCTSHQYTSTSATTAGPSTTTSEPTTTSAPTTSTTCACPPYSGNQSGIVCVSSTTSTTGAPTTSTTGGVTTSTTAGTTTSSSSTTAAPTTTTASPEGNCECQYPAFCGSTEGECTYTQCSTVVATPIQCQPGTSTTSCDCNTSTTGGPTTAPPGCTEGCDWVGIAAPGGGTVWHRVSNGCTADCACNAPSAAPNICFTAHTDCVVPQTTPAPDPFCLGYCDWTCIADDNGVFVWVSTFQNCRNLRVPTCHCDPPSYSCDECNQRERTPCGDGITGTTLVPPWDNTTTRGPCYTCYTTQTTGTTGSPTSTSTTQAGCQNCKLKWNGSSWDTVENNCSPCDCGPPGHDGYDICETIQVPCGTSTTTTAAPTTSTTCASCCTNQRWGLDSNADNYNVALPYGSLRCHGCLEGVSVACLEKVADCDWRSPVADPCYYWVDSAGEFHYDIAGTNSGFWQIRKKDGDCQSDAYELIFWGTGSANSGPFGPEMVNAYDIPSLPCNGDSVELDASDEFVPIAGVGSNACKSTGAKFIILTPYCSPSETSTTAAPTTTTAAPTTTTTDAPTTTTTAAPTTTTTSDPAALCPTYGCTAAGRALYQWQSGIWVMIHCCGCCGGQVPTEPAGSGTEGEYQCGANCFE
jgi:hypothetical protein